MQMTEDQIPAFVEDVLAIGCQICAIGHDAYVFGDSDVPASERPRVRAEARRITAKYGERDHLLLEIVAYLRRIGRYFPLESETRAGQA